MTRARTLLTRIGLAATAVVVMAGTAYSTLSPTANPYGVYSLLAVLSFLLEAGEGVPMGFVFVLFSLGHLSWIDTLFMADTSLFLAAVIYPARAKPRMLLQDAAATSLAAGAAHAAFHLSRIPGVLVPVHVFIAACVCFVCFHIFDWKREVLWTLPYYMVAASVSVLAPPSLVLPVLLLMIWRTYQLYERRLTRQREQSHQNLALYLRTVEALAGAIEARDQPTARHSRRVRIYAEEMGRELELPPGQQEALSVASLLYDIGELAIPEHIRLKPGRLTQEEFEKVKTHPEVGAAILEQVEFPYPVAPLVRAHHERWDGTGYPRGLKGNSTPVAARILAIADAVDSLASPRHHRSALPVEQAVAAVVAEAGKAFDPDLAAVLNKRWRKWEKLAFKNVEGGLESIFEAQREAELLRHLSVKLSASLEVDAVYAAAVQGLHRLLRFDVLVVWIEESGRLVPKHVAGEPSSAFASIRPATGSGISGRAASSGQVVVNGDPSRENESESLTPFVTPMRWALAAPLAAEELRGSVTLYRTDSGITPSKNKQGNAAGFAPGAFTPGAFTPNDARLLTMVTPALGTAIAKALKYREAHARAGADPLTGLPNAAALAERMRGLQGPCAVVVCDLDGFKGVNDRFGHLTGNRLLQEAANGFQRSCRTEDFVARVGGDEFVLLLDRGRPEDIEPRLSHFREVVRAVGRQVAGADVLDASFGTAYYPADSISPEELLKRADQNMYRCKQNQKSGVLALDHRVRSA